MTTPSTAPAPAAAPPVTPATTNTSSKIEDYVMLVAVTLGALATFFTNQQLTVFGMSPFLLAAVAASVGKGLAGLADINSTEDWVLVASTILGTLGTTLSGNASYVVYGLVIGQIGKAVLSFRGVNKGNVAEDALLFIMAVVTALGQATGASTLVNVGLFMGPLAKALPSLGAQK